MTQPRTSSDRWLEHAPLGRLHAILTSVPGALVYNPPAFKLHEELRLHPANRLLDIGCGRGALLSLLTARVAFQQPPMGLDVSRHTLTEAPSEAGFVQARPEVLPFRDETFDIVTCGYVSQFLDDDALQALLREIRRTLTLGGIALLWDFAPTRSPILDCFHVNVLSLLGHRSAVTRSYTTLSAAALQAGFEWVSNAHLRPFLLPPIPRVSLVIGKAPLGWCSGQSPELTPNTQARTLVTDASREQL